MNKRQKKKMEKKIYQSGIKFFGYKNFRTIRKMIYRIKSDCPKIKYEFPPTETTGVILDIPIPKEVNNEQETEKEEIKE